MNKPKSEITMNNQIDLSLWVKQGMEFYQNGKFHEAETLFRKALEVKPDYAHAWCMLGMLKWKQQRWEKAKEYLGKAVELQPENGRYLLKQAELFHHLQERDTAFAMMEKAVSFHDKKDIAQVALGKLHRKDQHWEAAEQAFREAVAINPDNSNAYNHLGNVLSQLNKLEEAEQCYLKVIEANPKLPQPFLNLGTIYGMHKQRKQALEYFGLALERKPEWALPYEKVIQLFMAYHDWMQALNVVQQALKVHPNHIPFLELKASIYGNVKSYAQVAKVAKQILEIDSNHAEANFQYGVVLTDNGRQEEAKEYFQKALSAKPKSDQYHIYLGRAYHDIGEPTLALKHFQEAMELNPSAFSAVYEFLLLKAKICDWSSREEDIQFLKDTILKQLEVEGDRGGAIPILTLNYFQIEPELHLKAAKHTARFHQHQVASIKKSLNFQINHASRKQQKVIKIGYYSPDFRNHAVGTLIQDMFQYHNRERFEIHAYSLITMKDNEIQEKIKKQVDFFTPVSNWSYHKVARKIYEDEIDILIDLGGYTSYTRTEVMALSPAPIQAHYIGLLDTMGADYIPYLLADDYCIPSNLEGNYSEEVVRLPQVFVSSPMKVSTQATNRDDWGLPENAFVFCSFNASYKIDPTCFNIWMEILKKVPNSVLWLAQSYELVRENLKQAAEAQGVASNRLVFCDKIPLEEHLERTKLADLFLDTFNFNGGAVTVGTLQVGLPILTLAGNTYASRIGGSILSKVGLEELVTHNKDAFIAKAIELANHPTKLRALASQIDDTQFFDTATFVRELEQAFEYMWEQYLADH